MGRTESEASARGAARRLKRRLGGIGRQLRPAAGGLSPPVPAAGLMPGKVAIVTGVGPSAESGSIENIGLATARRLLADGCVVVGTDFLDGGAALAAAADAVGAADRAHFERCDVRDSAAVSALVAKVAAEHGGVDLLAYVAGVGVETGGVDSLLEDSMELTVDVNLVGCIRFARACVPLMKAAGGGAIVNIASQLAISARPNMPTYIATKGGVSAFTRALAIDHAADGIRANSICPGAWGAAPAVAP
jgi:meso-butanediol dehydrogenase/(S,S)-butanediol dehydrogenase/diacetyl reductase